MRCTDFWLDLEPRVWVRPESKRITAVPLHRTASQHPGPILAAVILTFVAVLFSPAFVMNGARAQRVSRTPERDAAIELQIFARHKTAEAARRFADLTLTEIIGRIDRDCHLAPDQKRKLNLAGQGDISRFFHRVEAFKTEMYNRTEVPPGTEPAVAIRSMAICFQSGLFHDGSLLRKSLPTVLDTDQLAAYFVGVEKDRQRRHDVSIKNLIVLVGETTPFTPQEREQFQAVIKTEIPPCKSEGPFGVYYLVIQAGRLAKKQPDKFPNQRQREFLINFMHETEGFERILRDAGYFPIEEGDVGQTGGAK